MVKRLRVGIVTPSSGLDDFQLNRGVSILEERGLDIKVHRNCFKKHGYFAGSEADRLEPLCEFILDDNIDEPYRSAEVFICGSTK